MTLLLVSLFVSAGAALGQLPSGPEFEAQMVQVLEPEEPYTYHAVLKETPVHRYRRAANATPRPGELEVPAEGWSVWIPQDAGQVLTHAAEDFADYLRTSMGVTAKLSRRPMTGREMDLQPGIIVVTAQQAPDCTSKLRADKDYRIRVTPDQIVVCGFGERGAAYALYNLESRMNLREAPLLPRDLDTVRHSLYQTRMVLNWVGWMEWPDPYLSRLAHDGFDAIYASVYANPNGVEGPPHYDGIRQQTEARMNDLLTRAARFGIKVYTPILYRYTGTPENEQGLRSHVRDIVTKFPDIAGYILLTEGFYFDEWFGAGGQGDTDLKQWARQWTRGVEIVAEECHRIDSDIEIVPWEYNIDFRPQQAALKAYVMSIMPEATIPLLTWENGKSFDMGGLTGYLRDYSLNQIGPAEVTQAQIKELKRRGMKVYTKADTFASWQFGTTPYLPTPFQWHRRYEALEEYGVDGTHESWSNGYKPNFMTEVRAWYCWTDAPPLAELLRGIARRDFGEEAVDLVLQAWREFSEAIKSVVDTGPSPGTNNAVANPFFFQEPRRRTMTIEHSWWDQQKWMTHRRANINPRWPYVPRFLLFYPDFSNQVNQAETYARVRSGVARIEPAEKLEDISVLPIFTRHLTEAADRLEKGLRSYRKAAMGTPDAKRRDAFREVLIVEQMQRMLRSTVAMLDFEDLRFRLMTAEEQSAKRGMLDEMEAILADEISRTESSLEAAKRDSRLGYQMERDYVYEPFVIEEKLELLRKTLREEIPTYRNACCGTTDRQEARRRGREG
ncbi:MAG: hypothetical protein GEV06_22310 [Luteitalea sp.]|nr:hypothetical protein [Luteitalea sp.]